MGRRRHNAIMAAMERASALGAEEVIRVLLQARCQLPEPFGAQKVIQAMMQARHRAVACTWWVKAQQASGAAAATPQAASASGGTYWRAVTEGPEAEEVEASCRCTAWGHGHVVDKRPHCCWSCCSCCCR
jgi:hypothetical protein